MDDLSLDKCIEILNDGRVVHLGVADEDGPYVTPISFVVLRANVYMRTGPGRRVDALRKDNRVCIEVSRSGEGSGSWESVVGFGRASVVQDDQLIQEVVQALFSKYSEALGSPMSRGHSLPLAGGAVILEVKLDELTGRSSGSWLSIPTRPGRL